MKTKAIDLHGHSFVYVCPVTKERDRDCLRMIANGMKQIEIAKNIGCSPSRVRDLVERSFRKAIRSDRTKLASLYTRRYDRRGGTVTAKEFAATNKGWINQSLNNDTERT